MDVLKNIKLLGLKVNNDIQNIDMLIKKEDTTHKCGVYMIVNKDNEIVYIGMSKDINNRLNNNHKIVECYSDIISYYIVYRTRDYIETEKILIKAFNPIYNILDSIDYKSKMEIIDTNNKLVNILKSLDRNKNNKAHVAKELKLDRANMYRDLKKLKELGLLDNNYNVISGLNKCIDFDATVGIT